MRAPKRPVAGANDTVLTRPCETYSWQYANGDKATTRRDEVATEATGSGKDLSNVSPAPVIEEAKLEVRREAQLRSRLGGQVDGD